LLPLSDCSGDSMEPSERDIRDLSRAYLEQRSLDEYYRTMYPRPDSGKSPWRPVSNLTRDEIRKATIAYHLKRKWKLEAPAEMVDDFLSLIVSEDAMGRKQSVKVHVAGMDVERKRTLWERIWPFGGKETEG